ncbi:hypothetical protein [Sphingomonas sp. R1]|uniref:hypothetical protein n=1 Tax=Sphingomonas sp. R1 TaxID=399176 RepID=UPI002224705E|nr:hypothetical protein [Sphingomonas sp. R1]UYY75855.1 hypothetical protein OIM94_09915 [Sphingomonas sp. R1]
MTFGVSAIGIGGVRGATASSALHGTTGDAVDETAEAFLREAKKSPAERTKEAVLKRHSLSQAQYDALPPEKQAAIRQEIEEEMKRKLGRAQGGAFADVVV